MVFGSRRKKKKDQKVVAQASSVDTTCSRNDPNDSSGSISTLSSGNAPEHYARKYCHQDEKSAMAMFARMSTSIADNLTEQEFGNQVNKFYRPKAEYSSQIIYPVECKRDIFVQSVTPVKKGFRKPKVSSIYKMNAGGPTSPYHMSHDTHDCDSSIARRIAAVEKKDCDSKTDRSSPANSEKPTSDEKESKEDYKFDGPEFEMHNSTSEETYDLSHLSYSSSEDEEEDKENMTGVKGLGTDANVTNTNNRPFPPKVTTLSVDTSAKEEHLNVSASQHRLKGSPPRVKPLDSNRQSVQRAHGVGHVKAKSISRSTPLRPKGNLRIETGSDRQDVFLEADSYRRNGISNNDAIRSSYTLNPRSSAMEVSPSSTVSSLTIPAELEYNPTPREIFHKQMRSTPIMVAIDEDDNVITTHDYMSVKDAGELREI